MSNNLPSNADELVLSTWATFAPVYQELQQRALNADNVQDWLRDWSRLADHIEELYARLQVAVAANTTDAQAEERYNTFLDDIYPQAKAADQTLKEKLLASGFEPDGYRLALRNMRSEADLFRVENLALQTEESKLCTVYDKIAGGQVVNWEGEERTLDQMQPVLQDTNRQTRESAWRLVAERQLADREAYNQVWQQLLELRLKMAENAGRPDYRAYRWQELQRFDYTPEDARRFRDAIEAVVVPAAMRIYERRKAQLGVDTLRPWDLEVDPQGLPALRPFAGADELTGGISRMFHKVDPALGQQFDLLKQDSLLDLENRKNKAPGGFCTGYPVIDRPFIFMNAVGTHDDLQTLLHEGGHAFHAFAAGKLSYFQRTPPMEFAEVASMAMELLAAPYLTQEQGGFYTSGEAVRAQAQHLQSIILFWPYMAVVDGFQHWVYEHPEAAAKPEQCDAAWADLWRRFMRGVDWSGLEDVMETGWHRKLHIFTDPFYYIEYGLALLGSVQVWGQSLKDQPRALAGYRKALAMGGMGTLPELFAAAGARFALDAGALREAIGLLESRLAELGQA